MTPSAPIEQEPLFCPNCAYDLRHLASTRCPECGLPIDPTASRSRIPWQNRAQIGIRSALIRTLWIGTFRPAKVAAAAAGPVRYRDAAQFRNLATLIGAAGPIALSLLAFAAGWGSYLNLIGPDPLANLGRITTTPAPHSLLWESELLWSAGATLWPIPAISLLLTLLMATTAAAYWPPPTSAQPIRRQRYRALANYAAAPLAWLLLPALLSIAALAFVTHQGNIAFPTAATQLALAVLNLQALVAVFFLLACWYNALRVLALVTRCGMANVLTAAVGLPLLWFACAITGLAIFPAIVGFLRVAIDSVR